MSIRILLYGATGYSGRLIAAEALRGDIAAIGPEGRDLEIMLAGRDRIALEDMSRDCGLCHRVFGLEDPQRVVSALSQFDVVINAAGPFAQTANRLVRSAIAAGIQYVDINGEIDVYKKLDDLDRIATQREVTVVSGAGFTATVSDVMLEAALSHLVRDHEPLTVRIVMSAMNNLSRGSLQTMLRSVREQVTVVQDGAIVHVPVGLMERMFDFG